MSGDPIPPRIPPRTPTKAQPPAAPRAQTMPASTPMPQPGAPQEQISAKAATYYRMTRYVMVVLLIGMGGWFAYDGFIAWPAENQKIKELNKELEMAKKEGNTKKFEEVNANKLTHATVHSDSDIFLQKLLTVGCPALALFMLAWTLYQSRGEYRLSGETLSVPGHPPIKLGEITEIDKALWDRKGIAYVTYTTADGQSGRLRLDDFIYERNGTDEIFKRVEAYVTGESAEHSPGLAT